jgi:hypothetical protein
MTGGFPHSEISGSKVIWHLPETYRSHITSFIASWNLGIHHTPLHSCKECCTPLYNFTLMSCDMSECCLFDCLLGTKRPECSATRHCNGSNPTDYLCSSYMCRLPQLRGTCLCASNTKDFSNTPLSRVFCRICSCKVTAYPRVIQEEKIRVPAAVTHICE